MEIESRTDQVLIRPVSYHYLGITAAMHMWAKVFRGVDHWILRWLMQSNYLMAEVLKAAHPRGSNPGGQNAS
jgi:hypothetical protein